MILITLGPILIQTYHLLLFPFPLSRRFMFYTIYVSHVIITFVDHNDWRKVIIVKMLFIKMTFSTPKVLLVDNVLINNLIVLTLDLRKIVVNN